MKRNLFTLVIVLSLLTATQGWGASGVSWKIKNPSLTVLYLEGSDSSQTRGGIKAVQHSLIYNNEGLEFKQGLNYYLNVELSGKVSHFEIVLEPFHKGFLRFATSQFNLDIGKESLWWGQGEHGGLFLTHNAAPLPMIRLFNPTPTLLPSIFRYLGPFQFDIFVSQLEADRVVPKPYFQGTRITFKPHSILDVGLTRTIIMGGEGQQGISPARYFDIWFGENKETAAEDLSNSIAGLDFRLTFPEVQFYGEIGGEDEAGGYPSKDAFLLGVYFPEGTKGNDLRIEYADLSNPAWYVHSLYQSGYTYKGRILGHHVGGGGRDIFFEKGIVKTDRASGKLHLDYEERGIKTESVRERHYQVGTNWKLNGGKVMIPWTVHAGVAYDWIRNAGYTLGLNQRNALFTFSLIGQI